MIYVQDRAKISLSRYDDKRYILEDGITTEDVYEDMGQYKDEFDFSGYDKSNPLYSTINKKIAGKFKDEKNGIPLVEFVGLRAKMYVTRDLDIGESPKRIQKLSLDEQATAG